MDGLELCKILKANHEYSHILVILLMAKNDIQTKIDGLELGADAYIEKPFSKEHLQAQIESLLNNRNIIREYFASSPLIHIKNMTHSKADEIFLETLQDIIKRNLDNTNLDVENLAQIMNMSRITLYRKIKAVSVFTPIELINITLLKKEGLSYWRRVIIKFLKYPIWLGLVLKAILLEIFRNNLISLLRNT